MAYIANKPVRFDRNYKVGEIIPPEVIEPKMIRKLKDMGRIVYVDLPTDRAGHDSEDTDEISESSQESAQDMPDGMESTEGINIWDNEKTEQDGQDTLPEQQCESDGSVEFMNQPQESVPDGVETVDQAQESAQDAAERDGEFTCSVCGKKFGSKNALSAHSRSHK